MELAFITVKFDSPEEQKFVEENIDLGVYDRFEDPDYTCWTEFDISGCEPYDIYKMFEEVQDKYNEGK